MKTFNILNNLEEVIKITTEPFKHELALYRKELGWDVYLNGQCVKINASREDVQMLYKTFKNE